jgi:hypothetical protein
MSVSILNLIREEIIKKGHFLSELESYSLLFSPVHQPEINTKLIFMLPGTETTTVCHNQRVAFKEEGGCKVVYIFDPTRNGFFKSNQKVFDWQLGVLNNGLTLPEGKSVDIYYPGKTKTTRFIRVYFKQ